MSDKEEEYFVIDEEEQECMQKTLAILNKCKADIIRVWEKEGNFDFGMFDVNINLSVEVDEEKVEVKEKWKRSIME